MADENKKLPVSVQEIDEIVSYAKEKLADYPDILKEVTTKGIKIKGVTKNEDGEVLRPRADYAWDYLTKPQEGREDENQLELSRRHEGAKNVVPVTFGATKNYFVSEVAGKEMKPENSVSGTFPESFEFKGSAKKCPAVTQNYKNPLLLRLTGAEMKNGVKENVHTGEKYDAKVFVGLVDERQKTFHKFCGRNAQDIFFNMITPDPVSFCKKEIDGLLANLQKRDAGDNDIEINTKIYVEPVEIKKNFARSVALVENYPFLALYLPPQVLVNPVMQEAFSKGLEATGQGPFNFSRNNVRYSVKNEKAQSYDNKSLPLDSYIRKEVLGKDRAKASLIVMNNNLIKAGIKSNELSSAQKIKELIKDELDYARNEIKEAKMRDVPAEREALEKRESEVDKYFAKDIEKDAKRGDDEKPVFKQKIPF